MIILLQKYKGLRMLFLGGVISSVGDYLYDIALTLLVYDITGTIDSIAVMWISKGALRIFIQYFAGILTDKYNRRNIIAITNFLSVPCALIFLMISKETVWVAYIGTFLLQSLNDIDMCSEVAILPELVEKNDIAKANTLFFTAENIMMFISLALSGFLYKYIGADILFIINAVSFFLSGIFFMFIEYNHNSVNCEKQKLVLFDKGAIHEILRNHSCLIIILISLLFSALSRLYDVYNIDIADKILHIGSEGMIYFRYAMAVGSILVPIAIKLYKGKDIVKQYLLISFIIAVLFILIPFSKYVALTLIIIGVMALLLAIQGVYVQTIIQQQVDNNYLGRVFASYKILLTLASLITVAVIPIINKCFSVNTVFAAVGVVIAAVCFFIYCMDKHKSSVVVE